MACTTRIGWLRSASGPVLLFDSGVGGLSVADALRQHYPHLAMCYACDNAWLPYGLRDDVTLSQRIVSVCKAAVDACQASVLVVACNTASTLALEGLACSVRYSGRWKRCLLSSLLR